MSKPTCVGFTDTYASSRFSAIALAACAYVRATARASTALAMPSPSTSMMPGKPRARSSRKRASACVNVLPGATSIYRWKGAVEEASEVLLVAKTTAARAGDLEAALAKLHPYEVPELVLVAADHVEAKYLAWLVESTR